VPCLLCVACFPGPPIHHFDLYRLQQQPSQQQQQQPSQQQQQLQPADARSLSRLDLPASYSSAVCLLEWADVLPPELVPQQRLEVMITALSQQQQQVVMQQQQVAQEQQQVALTQQQQPGAGAGGGASAAAQPSSREGPPQQQVQQLQQQAWLIQLPDSSSSSAAAAAICESDRDDASYDEWSGGAADSVSGSEAELSISQEEDDPEEDDPFTDQRWRLVELVGVGPAWQQRLASVAQQL
jgi:tRNA A37 threonylcarbamoyladenosine biosynthesis protein TsaE